MLKSLYCVWPPSQVSLLSLLTKDQSNNKISHGCHSIMPLYFTIDLIACVYHLLLFVHYRACLALQCIHQEVFVHRITACFSVSLPLSPLSPPSPTSEQKTTPASRKKISTRNKRSNAISLSTLYQDEEEDVVRFPGDEDPDFVPLNTPPFKARKKQKRC